MEGDRKVQILQWLYQNGTASVTALSQILGYSEATVRRDLQHLAREGQVVRTHGGASVRVPEPNPRATRQMSEKSRIGTATAQLVQENDAIGFNGGSTTYFVARGVKAMHSQWNLTAVTNALHVATELSVDTAFKVVVIGGVVSKRSLELGGPLAVPFLQGLHLNKVFVGVDGFSLEHGITTYYEVEGSVTKHLIAQSEQVVVVADHTKLGKVAFAQIAPADVVHTLVTDTDAAPEFVAAVAGRGIRVIQA